MLEETELGALSFFKPARVAVVCQGGRYVSYSKPYVLLQNRGGARTFLLW